MKKQPPRVPFSADLARSQHLPCELGWLEHAGLFRLQAPIAQAVALVMRIHPESLEEIVLPLERARHRKTDFWQVHVAQPLRYYRYRVTQGNKVFDIADPRARAVARQHAVGHRTWAVAQTQKFDWRQDERLKHSPQQTVVLELHVRDFTIHPSSGVPDGGSYLGVAQASSKLLDLGVNAVELLPCASFPLLEPTSAPPNDPARYVNPTGVNHWGYMPSFLFAPSERYGRAGVHAQPGAWVGVADDGSFADPALELMEMVRQLHRDGIAVIVDIVLNHLSIDDDNPLALLDPGTWQVRNPDGSLRSHSGCGNDINSRDPVMRAFLVDTCLHWMRTFHLDGLRLDLAEIVDEQTLSEIASTIHAEFPNALLIAEPWSLAGYKLKEIAELGFIVWNDRFRNGIKGRDPLFDAGFIFGCWQGHLSRADVAAMLLGSTQSLGGPLREAAHCVNYLACHDNLTLGDFVRLAAREVAWDQLVLRSDLARVTEKALKIQKLAAAALLLSAGMPMLAQGQEWGRAQVQSIAADWPGPLDGNAYNRDDATSHLDWRERDLNLELVKTYKDLIALRRQSLVPAFEAHCGVEVVAGNQACALGYVLAAKPAAIAVLLNGSTDLAWFSLPGGPWSFAYGGDCAHIVPVASGVAVQLLATSAVVLRCN